MLELVIRKSGLRTQFRHKLALWSRAGHSASRMSGTSYPAHPRSEKCRARTQNRWQSCRENAGHYPRLYSPPPKRPFSHHLQSPPAQERSPKVSTRALLGFLWESGFTYFAPPTSRRGKSPSLVSTTRTDLSMATAFPNENLANSTPV